MATQLKTVTEISYVLFMAVVREMDLIKDPDAEARGRMRRDYVIGRLGEKRANLFFNIYKQIYDQEIDPRFHNVRLMTDNTMQITLKPQDKPKPVHDNQSVENYLITLAMLGAMINPKKG